MLMVTNVKAFTVSDKGSQTKNVLSPQLFNIYAEYIMRRATDQWQGGPPLHEERNLLFADDTQLYLLSVKRNISEF